MSEEQIIDAMIERILKESYTSLGKTGTSPRVHKNLTDALMDFEKEILKNATSRCQTTYELAGFLGISQTTAFRKLKKHGLTL